MRLTDLLDIPEEHVANVPCQVTPRLYTDKMLDVDLDDPEFLDLTHAQQRARLQMKQAAEQRAAAACQSCPILAECREWAMRTHVFGVAGGMTQAERSRACGNVVPDVAELTERGPRRQVNGDAIARWTAQGMTTRQISTYLNASERTVTRYRARLSANGQRTTVEDEHVLINLPAEITAADIEDDKGIVLPDAPSDTAATSAINFDRVSPETLAMYRGLSDGAVRSREEIIAAAGPFVDDDAAAKAGKHLSDDRERQIAGGRRKFVLNRIDIAVRRGRVQTAKVNGTVVLWLDASTQQAFHDWCARTAQPLPVAV